MSDLISRQAVLDYPIRLDHYDEEHGNRHFVLGIESVMEYVEYLPSAEPQWIPVSERLPRENKEVLISCEWGVDIGQYDADGWRSEWINHYDDDSVLAWMPLPPPYEGVMI